MTTDLQTERYKQTILIRKDLKMRRGKEVAQGSHASMAFLVDQLREQLCSNDSVFTINLSDAQRAWLTIGVAKVCLRVQSQEELLSYHQRALQAGLDSHLIRDSGRTEFGGVPTLTACAIGPDHASLIDQITADLTLY